MFGGYAEHMGFCTLVKAELKVVAWGLRLAKDRGLHELCVNPDSLVVAGFLQGNYQTPLGHYSLIQQCKNLISGLGWQVLISHCYRKANTVVDKITNIGVQLNGQFCVL